MFAIKVWKHFENIFLVPHVFRSITQALSLWMVGCSVSSQYGMNRIGIAAFIFREIWVARFRATYDNYTMNVREICLKVTRKTQLVNLVYNSKPPSNKLNVHILESMRIMPNDLHVRRGIWCKWDRPPRGWYKLNIDGSVRGNGSAGGGIIRSIDGALVAAFSYYYGEGSNNLAEFLALKDGMLLCKALNLSPVLIESDSSIVVTAVRSAHGDNWRLAYILRECVVLYTSDFELIHGYRQKNVVTDRLVAHAYSHQGRHEFFCVQDFPLVVRAGYSADRMDLWNYRP